MPKGLRRQCTICCHPERGRIDYLLVCSARNHGEGRRALAQKFDVSADALWRHGKNHISDEYRAAVKIGPFESEDALRKLVAETGASVLDRYNSVYSGHLSRWLIALESGNDDAMIKHGSVMAALEAKVGILTRECCRLGRTSRSLRISSLRRISTLSSVGRSRWCVSSPRCSTRGARNSRRRSRCRN